MIVTPCSLIDDVEQCFMGISLLTMRQWVILYVGHVSECVPCFHATKNFSQKITVRTVSRKIEGTSYYRWNKAHSRVSLLGNSPRGNSVVVSAVPRPLCCLTGGSLAIAKGISYIDFCFHRCANRLLAVSA